MTRYRKHNEVWLYAYDLACGVGSIIGVHPLYHSSIVINEKEIAFGPNGITVTLADCSSVPVRRMHLLGHLEIEMDLLMKYLSFLNQTKFQGRHYNVFNHNCNVFTRFLAKEIVHCDIPEYLHNVPTDVIESIPEAINTSFKWKTLFSWNRK